MSTPEPSSIELTPLLFEPSEPLVARLRALVLAEPQLAAAFLYRRGDATLAAADDGASLTPTVGLLSAHGHIDPQLVDRAVSIVGRIHGRDPSIVGLNRAGLEPVVHVAAPIGAGGDVEAAMAAAVAAAAAGTDQDDEEDVNGGDGPGGKRRIAPMLRLALAVADAVLTLPARPPLTGPGRLRPDDQVPLAVIDGPDGPMAAAFTSDLALLHTRPPVPGAVRIPGKVLAASLPEGVDIALDPGCALSSAVPARLVSAVGRDAPRGAG
jgi:hypothetical protein